MLLPVKNTHAQPLGAERGYRQSTTSFRKEKILCILASTLVTFSFVIVAPRREEVQSYSFFTNGRTEKQQQPRPAMKNNMTRTEAATSRDRHAHETGRRIRACDKAVLFSMMRSGSTWLLNSIDDCRYSRRTEAGQPSFDGRVFHATELWYLFGEARHGHLYTPEDAAAYITTNRSVKIFPNAMEKHEVYVRELMRMSRQNGLSVFVLERRDMDAVWRSMHNADKGGDWHIQSGHPSQTGSQDRNDSSLEALPPTLWNSSKASIVKGRIDHFRNVHALLQEERVPYDRFWYEDIKDEPAIVASANDCVIWNCNFGKEDYDKALIELALEEPTSSRRSGRR